MHPPPVLWAQRADKILLKIDIEDCKSPVIKLEKDRLYFKGKSDSIQKDVDHNEHEVSIEFFKPIKVEESSQSVKARGIDFIIIKEEETWWPRLLKDSKKQHWLKVDFPKWKDEDDSEDEIAGGMGGPGGQPDFSDLMQQFGGGMGGMGGMPGMGMGGEGDDEDELDSEDDDETKPDMPDLEPSQ